MIYLGLTWLLTHRTGCIEMGDFKGSRNQYRLVDRDSALSTAGHSQQLPAVPHRVRGRIKITSLIGVR